MVAEITPEELQQRRQAGNAPTVLDVREPWEVQIASIPDVIHIPMGELVGRLGELDPARELVVMCRSGGRSIQVAQYLERQGFRSVANLTGGILAWARTVDPSLSTY